MRSNLPFLPVRSQQCYEFNKVIRLHLALVLRAHDKGEFLVVPDIHLSSKHFLNIFINSHFPVPL